VIEVLEYTMEDGRVPFREWLVGNKDEQVIARVDVRLSRTRLGDLGDHRAIGQGVTELRLAFGPG